MGREMELENKNSIVSIHFFTNIFVITLESDNIWRIFYSLVPWRNLQQRIQRICPIHRVVNRRILNYTMENTWN